MATVNNVPFIVDKLLETFKVSNDPVFKRKLLVRIFDIAEKFVFLNTFIYVVGMHPMVIGLWILQEKL